MKKTLYRADDYYRNMGDVVGFYESKEQAEADIKYKTPANGADGNFSQITEFSSDVFWYPDTDNRNEMMKLWENGEIINTYFYV